DFIKIVGGAAAAWPYAARAQQSHVPASGKSPVIAFLGGATPAMWAPWTGAFVERLKGLGWIEGQTVKLEVRWAEGRQELYTQYDHEFAELNPNVIFATGAGVRAVTKATSTVPVITFANEPLGTGMVKSLARPSGNVTGISLQNLDLANKRFEFLREVVPNIRRLACMAVAPFTPTILASDTLQELAPK